MAETAEAGEDAIATVEEARGLLAQAFDVVIPQDLRGTPAFTGGVMIQLLFVTSRVAARSDPLMCGGAGRPACWKDGLIPSGGSRADVSTDARSA